MLVPGWDGKLPKMLILPLKYSDLVKAVIACLLGSFLFLKNYLFFGGGRGRGKGWERIQADSPWRWSREPP